MTNLVITALKVGLVCLGLLGGPVRKLPVLVELCVFWLLAKLWISCLSNPGYLSP